jgi:hypothetical protein
MSQEDVDRFVDATEAFNRNDLEAWLRHYDAEVVFEPQVAVMEGAYVGHDGIRAFASNMSQSAKSRSRTIKPRSTQKTWPRRGDRPAGLRAFISLFPDNPTAAPVKTATP